MNPAGLGRVRASQISAVLAKGKGKTRASLRDQLVAERLTGQYAPSYESDAMRWGSEQEPFARAAYEAATGQLVDKLPGRSHPRLESGASADGEIGDEGILEIKCPNTATHVGWMIDGVVPPEHVPQMQWQLACYPERKWSDFASYDVRMPEPSRLWIAPRLVRDDAWIAMAEAEVEKFLAEVAGIVARYRV
jgi:predicted phage-related endonuclease